MSDENNDAGNADSGNDGGIDGGANVISGIEIGKPTRIDPTSASGTDSGNPGTDGRRKRSDAGRKRGNYGSRKSAPAGISEEKTVRVDVITGILFSLHTMAAVKIPEMAMTEHEAQAVANAYAHVAEFYPMLQQTAKAAAWSELLCALGMVYGTRFVAVRNRMVKGETNADNVTAFDPSKRKNP